MSDLAHIFNFYSISQNDCDSISSLYRLAYSKDFSQSWYRWWNFKNPFGQSINIGLKKGNKNELIAHFSAVPIRVPEINSGLLTYLTYGLAIHPTYQNKGIGYYIILNMLERIKNNNSLLTYGFPNQNSYELHKLVGYQHLIDFKIYRFIDQNNSVVDHDLSLQLITETELERLYIKQTPNENCLFDLGLLFLKWRFFQSSNKYNYFEFAYKDKSIGYIITKEYYGDIDIVQYDLLKANSEQDQFNEKIILSAFRLLNQTVKYKNLLCWLSDASKIYRNHETNWSENASRTYPYCIYKFDKEFTPNFSDLTDFQPSFTEYF